MSIITVIITHWKSIYFSQFQSFAHMLSISIHYHVRCVLISNFFCPIYLYILHYTQFYIPPLTGWYHTVPIKKPDNVSKKNQPKQYEWLNLSGFKSWGTTVCWFWSWGTISIFSKKKMEKEERSPQALHQLMHAVILLKMHKTKS